MKYTKFQSLLIVAFVYVGSLACTFILLERLTFGLLLNSLIADIFCTTLVFVFSVRFRNTSIYDAYWSVIPPALMLYWMYKLDRFFLQETLLLAGMGFWAIRLTWNWAYGWKGLAHEDWRYVNMQKKTGKFYWIVSYLGLHMFPTLLVFFGCIPAFYFLQAESSGIKLYVGLVIMIAATLIEWSADRSMHQHKRTSDGGIITRGLWKYSRHPNYLGEILLWIGFWIACSGANIPFWTLVGPVAMILLFVGISIPMMEKKLHSRPGYHEYKKRTSMLIPLPPRT